MNAPRSAVRLARVFMALILLGLYPARSDETNASDADRLREALRALRESVVKAGRASNRPARPGNAPPPRASTGLVPLDELGKGGYKGSAGGLYPDGSNARPAAHEEAGRALAREVRPRDREGKPAEEGRIVLLSIGMSNTTQEFSTFQRLARSESGLNPRLTLVDGAQGGMTGAVVASPESPRGRQFWATVADRLTQAGVTPAQVQAAWIKEADAGPGDDFPGYPRTLQKELGQIARLLKEKFPNLKLAYLSSRIYGGYATTPLNPEPYAYESGFAVKWLIEEQLKGAPDLNFDAGRGPVRAPWLAWGPYLWADGISARRDGLTYQQTDFAADGTHPATEGRAKVARLMLDFFKSDATARPWFLTSE